MGTVSVATGVELEHQIAGEGEETILLVTGTTASIGLWGPVIEPLADAHRVIAYDHRGMGGSTRGSGQITVASLAEDANALLEALGVGRAHVIGWSLGSAIAQELALAHPERVASIVMYGTWGRCDGYQRSLLAGLRAPWAAGDVEAALTGLGIAFSPQLLDDPAFAQMFAEFAPMFPQTPEQVQTTVEQWDADLAHDTLDRLADITAPTTVLVGEQDLLTPPWQSKAVADRIPGADYRLVEGPGSSHGMHLERTDDWLVAVGRHLRAAAGAEVA